MKEAEGKKKLSQGEYRIIREKGTEPALSGKYWDHKEKGVYTCAGCGAPLFSSEAKFDSGSGWPSFWQPEKWSVEMKRDDSHGMVRMEVLCMRCKGHLGHVFEDGPKPTGKRYCINSAALRFKKRKIS